MADGDDRGAPRRAGRDQGASARPAGRAVARHRRRRGRRRRPVACATASAPRSTSRWLELARDDDFVGVQNYERICYDGRAAPSTPTGRPLERTGCAPPSTRRRWRGAVRYAHEATGRAGAGHRARHAAPTTTAVRAAFIEPSLRGPARRDRRRRAGARLLPLDADGQLRVDLRLRRAARACTRSTGRRSCAPRSRAPASTPRWSRNTGVDELSPVRFEHHREALGIGEATPRLSWQALPSEGFPEPQAGWAETTDGPAHPADNAEQGWRQAAYELAIGDEVFRVASPDSVLVPWPAAPLSPREARTVRVRVSGEDGRVSDWSDPAVVERGLDAGCWRASLIEPSPGERGPAALLRHSFTVDGEIASARLYATAHGIYVARDQRPPGRRRRARARLDQLPPPAALPDLRRDGPAAGRGERDRRHGRRRLVARPARLRPRRQGHLRDLARRCSRSSRSPTPTAAGRSSAPTTPGAARPGPVRAADLYDGEHYDARLELPGWSAPGFDDSAWSVARGRLGLTSTRWSRRTGPPVRATEGLTVRTATGRAVRREILDFGQNLVGRLRIRVRGRRGATVTLRHAEVLERRRARDRARCAPRGPPTATRCRGDGGARQWEPEFTFHGFRYAEVQATGRRAAPRTCRRRLPLRHGAHRLVRVLRRAAQPAARERRLGHARQLRRRADRLPAARRAARLDRRHPGVRADRELPVRLRGLPRLLAARPRRRADSRRGRCRCSCRASTSPDRSRSPRRRPAGATPRCIVPVGRSTSASATPAILRRAVPEHARLGRRADAACSGAEHAVGRAGLPVRRLARPGRAARPAAAAATHRPGPGRHRLPGARARTCSRGSPRCSARTPTRPVRRAGRRRCGRRSATST